MKQAQQEAIAELQQMLKPGMTVYTILRHVSQSGMTRHISLVIFENNEPRYLDYAASKALGWRLSKDAGIVISGCGMDMGFHVVYELSATLFRNPDGSYSHEGAYALKQRWL